MNKEYEAKNPLINELSLLHKRIAELEESVASHEQAEAHYRLLYEENIEGYASINMDGYLQEYNSAFRKMVGYADEELRGMTYLDLTPDKWKDMEDKILRDEVLSEKSSHVYEKEFRRKDGSIFPVELRTYLILNRNDQPAGMWAFIRDITERKQ